jgi:hypothetical protein
MNISSIDSISFAIANNNDKHQFIHNWYMVGLPLIPTIDIQPDYIQNNERMVIDIDSNQSLTKAILKIDHFGQSLPTECNLNFSNCPNINEVHLKAFVYAVASNLNVNIANGTYPSSGTIYRHNTTGFHDKIVIHNVPSGWVVKDE